MKTYSSYISEDLAICLKDFGYDDWCDTYYNIKGEVEKYKDKRYIQGVLWYKNEVKNSELDLSCVAPKLGTILDWIEENLKIIINLELIKSKNNYKYFWKITEIQNNSSILESNSKFIKDLFNIDNTDLEKLLCNSPKEAYEKAILEIIENYGKNMANCKR